MFYWLRFINGLDISDVEKRRLEIYCNSDEFEYDTDVLGDEEAIMVQLS